MTKITSLDDMRPWLDAHQALSRLDEFRSLGRFHACIDAADAEIEAKLFDRLDEGLGDFKRLELTSFGQTVGADVPRWWVFAGEPNVRELVNYTRLTFPAAQKLVRSAEKIGRKITPTYEQLIQELGEFLQRHSREIEALLKYASDLSMKNELAPAILFSYAVWGSTKRGDRSMARYLNLKSTDKINKIILAGELALGICKPLGPILFLEWHGLLNDMGDVAPSAATLLQAAQNSIRESILTYFTEIRDSLRHIDTLCQEFIRREEVYADDRFAKRLLKKITGQTAVVESDLWDIKKTLEMWSQSTRKEQAKIDFAESVAAFANKRGGVLLIGITDKTREIVGVDKAETSIKHMESVLLEYLDPYVDLVRTRAVPLDGLTKPFIIVVVGQTEVPIGVRQINDNYSYPLRVGSGIERVSLEQIRKAKAGLKGTTFSFLYELVEWVSDVT